jgi:1-acyl-sn-glycerol-3-phosphate acyltransferase
MGQQLASASVLMRYIVDDLFRSVNLPTSGWLRQVLAAPLRPPLQRFVDMAAEFDRIVAEEGFREGMRWMTARYVRGVTTFGVEQVPQEGPLLLVSNHPGTFDGIVIASQLPRRDLTIVASGFPFLRSLPATSRHLILVANNDPYGRMSALRTMIRRLRAGEALMIFPSGRIEPDPDLLPGAHEALEAWSPSLELIMRKVPEAKIMVSIISGVVAPSCLHYPFVRLRPGVLEQQKMAGFVQLVQQMFFPHRFGLVPRISFGPPLSLGELSVSERAHSLNRMVVERAQQLLTLHAQRSLALVRA